MRRKVRHNAPRLHMLGFVCDCGRENKCVRHRNEKVLCGCGRLYKSVTRADGTWEMQLIGKDALNG